MKKQHVLIDFLKQTKIANLTNVELLNELPFYSRQKRSYGSVIFE